MWIHPALFFFAGALLLPWVPKRAGKNLFMILPVLAALDVLTMQSGHYGRFSFAGNPLLFGRVDRLSLIFAHIFTLISVIGAIYALRMQTRAEPVWVCIYAGSALGAVFAGDLITLFLFWEMMAIASTGIIWCGAKPGSPAAGLRYLLVHLAGGASLLLGIALHVAAGHDLRFDALTQAGGLGPLLILIGFLVNAAAVPLHAWLPDAYPEASATGTVFLSAFTTKTAVYVLVRGFSGTEALVIIGVLMALYGVVYAMMENHVRRLLSYHIVSQVGFMVAGVGIGTPLAINGAVAHAFAHILYKALLMMGMGSVLEMTGKEKGTELGGLRKYMPWTAMLYLIGGVSISGVPLFSGFVSKGMVLSAAEASHRPIVYLLMTLASCGTFLSTTLKLPYMVFFGEERGAPASDPPKNMILGMSLAAGLCFLIGVLPGLLYTLLPYETPYSPYTIEHVSASVQLLLATAVVFLIFLPKLTPHAAIHRDFDRLYRFLGRIMERLAFGPVAFWEKWLDQAHRRWGIRPVLLLLPMLKRFEARVIDGMVMGVGQRVEEGSRTSNFFEKYVVYAAINAVGYANHIVASLLRILQTGSVHHYAMMVIMGFFFLVHLYWFFEGGSMTSLWAQR